MFLSGSSKLLHTVYPKKMCSIFRTWPIVLKCSFFTYIAMSCHVHPHPLFYEDMCNQFGIYDYFSSSKCLAFTCQNLEPSDMRQVLTEQENGRTPDENKTTIHMMSSFQPSGLSRFEWRTPIFYKIIHNSVKVFLISLSQKLQYRST